MKRHWEIQQIRILLIHASLIEMKGILADTYTTEAQRIGMQKSCFRRYFGHLTGVPNPYI